jgi:hypothetical protein
MAKTTKPIMIDGTEHLFPMNDPVTITIDDQQIRCTLHDLDGKGVVPVRHIDIQAATSEERTTELCQHLHEWIAIGYTSPEQIRDELEHGLTLLYQQQARRIVTAKEPTERQIGDAFDALPQERRIKLMQDGYAAVRNAGLIAAREQLAQSNAIDPRRLFDELLGL